MKTEKISNYSFNGKLIYIGKDGKQYSDCLSKKLPNLFKYREKYLNISLKNQLFDVFVSEAKTPLHYNVYTSNGFKRTKTRVVNEMNLGTAIFDSIANFRIGNFE